MKFAPYIFSILLIASSCVKDKPPVKEPSEVSLSSQKKVYVINEGNFTNGNASISLYDNGSNQVIEDYYNTQNNSDIGDVAQSMARINGLYYIVVNNSGKIEICDQSFKKTGQIKGLNSPRYILQVSNQKAYVSDFKNKGIHVINLNDNSKLKTIVCNGWSERMALIYNKAFITCPQSDYLLVINTQDDAKMDSILVYKNAYSLVIDKNDKLWVLNSGDSVKNQLPKLMRINPITLQTELNFSFKPGDHPGNLCINRSRDTLYYLNKGIWQLATSSTALVSNPLIEAGNRNFYGLDVNPNDYMIYASDALDYIQRSNIYIFKPNGEKFNQFKAGINAGNFYFE